MADGDRFHVTLTGVKFPERKTLAGKECWKFLATANGQEVRPVIWPPENGPLFPPTLNEGQSITGMLSEKHNTKDGKTYVNHSFSPDYDQPQGQQPPQQAPPPQQYQQAPQAQPDTKGQVVNTYLRYAAALSNMIVTLKAFGIDHGPVDTHAAAFSVFKQCQDNGTPVPEIPLGVEIEGMAAVYRKPAEEPDQIPF